MREDLADGLLREMGGRVPGQLVDFGRALDAYFGGGVLEWHYFLVKPWKWSREYTEWVNADSPQEGDEGWDAFDGAMDVIVNV